MFDTKQVRRTFHVLAKSKNLEILRRLSQGDASAQSLLDLGFPRPATLFERLRLLIQLKLVYRPRRSVYRLSPLGHRFAMFVDMIERPIDQED